MRETVETQAITLNSRIIFSRKGQDFRFRIIFHYILLSINCDNTTVRQYKMYIGRRIGSMEASSLLFIILKIPALSIDFPANSSRDFEHTKLA